MGIEGIVGNRLVEDILRDFCLKKITGLKLLGHTVLSDDVCHLIAL